MRCGIAFPSSRPTLEDALVNAYTNARGVLHHSTRLDLGVRYPPYDHNQALRRTLAHLRS